MPFKNYYRNFKHLRRIEKTNKSQWKEIIEMLNNVGAQNLLWLGQGQKIELQV